jgi:ankyrin repeat protein
MRSSKHETQQQQHGCQASPSHPPPPINDPNLLQVTSLSSDTQKHIATYLLGKEACYYQRTCKALFKDIGLRTIDRALKFDPCALLHLHELTHVTPLLPSDTGILHSVYLTLPLVVPQVCLSLKIVNEEKQVIAMEKKIVWTDFDDQEQELIHPSRNTPVPSDTIWSPTSQEDEGDDVPFLLTPPQTEEEDLSFLVESMKVHMAFVPKPDRSYYLQYDEIPLRPDDDEYDEANNDGEEAPDLFKYQLNLFEEEIEGKALVMDEPAAVLYNWIGMANQWTTIREWEEFQSKFALFNGLVPQHVRKATFWYEYKNSDQITSCTLLHLACKNGVSLDLVKFIVENAGADIIDKKNSINETALHIATADERHDILKYLIYTLAGYNSEDHMNALQEQDETGYTPLHYACASANRESVYLLLDSCGDRRGYLTRLLSLRTKSNATALHLACYHDDAEIVRRLIKAASDDHLYQVIFGYQRLTPLHLACQFANEKVVKALIEAGGSRLLHAEDNDGNTPLHILLCRYELNCFFENDFTERRNETTIKSVDEILHLLVEAGGRDVIHARNNRGETPLRVALEMDNHSAEVFQLLIKAGGNDVVHVSDNMGRKPIEFAHDAKIEEMLVEAAGGRADEGYAKPSSLAINFIN